MTGQTSTQLLTPGLAAAILMRHESAKSNDLVR